jgi:hypothetical protein
LFKLASTPDNVGKPTKTTKQLDPLVKQEAAKTMSPPMNVVVSVWLDGDSLKVVCHSPDPREDKELFELIRRVADRLKLKFDLQLSFAHSRAALFLSSSLTFRPEDKAIVGPDFDGVILDEPLCSNHNLTIVAANGGFKLETPAVFRRLHRRQCCTRAA